MHEAGPYRRPSAAFLDRDGTLIEDRGYLDDPSAVTLIPGAPEAVARLNALGIPAILVTNQSGIGRELFTEEAFFAVQREVDRQLARRGCALDAVFYCPHDPDDGAACECRKPGPALYREAADRFGIELSEALYIGDRPSDVAPSLRWGGSGVLVRTGRTVDPARVPEAVAVAEDLAAALELALRRRRESSVVPDEARERGTGTPGVGK